ncbi:hypothetical protein [Pseudomonas rustica]|uniref:Uncharacterized protein n=1 Tax=Pseudomonas rustica TaxID=2827099 RepID=A0ABS5N1T8_9PSED|nr:hypothetical protein [Pseudomonas rustica]MBS4079757.1 hypothetical protein [Pseudomonas rustica]MBS4088948.1 hypothetical protein [Pseudomonas rustica]
MKKAELEEYLEGKINDKARLILDEDMVHDGAALGEMQFYFCMRRILNKKANLEDVGTLRAMNNLMRMLGLLSPKETLRSKIEK